MKPILLRGTVLSALALMPLATAHAKVVVLYSFGALNSVTDGNYPAGPLVMDGAGNLYGVTSNGGPYNQGTVFELSPPAAGQKTWTETVLYNFKGTTDGKYPNAPLVIDTAGNLYGTAYQGGAHGVGDVFELSPPAAGQTGWTRTVLYSFKTGKDGQNPNGGLAFDAAGNLYGATYTGGAFGTSTYNNGTVFELQPPAAGQTVWTETLLHSFNASATDGGSPNGGLIFDSSGNIYGTSFVGGSNPGSNVACYSGAVGCGTVFKLSPPAAGQTAWTASLLFSFNNTGTTPDVPEMPVTMDSAGNLYGCAPNGGTNNFGGIYKLTNKGSKLPWPLATLYTFSTNVGFLPSAPVLRGKVLYGTTYEGGVKNSSCSSGCGTSFKLALGSHKYTTTNQFGGTGIGIHPYGVIFDANGNQFGTTYQGGTNNTGTVFEIIAK